MYVHLINDEKFLPPFMKRAQKVIDNHLYIVFGPKPPYKFLDGADHIIHASQWEEYKLQHNVEVERIYIHLMTYQKINWVKAMPKTPVYWLFYGNDLYELLLAFKGFKLYEKADAPKGVLTNIKGKTLSNRLQRWAKLRAYHRHYAPFVKEHVDYWCFWSPGDFELLTKHYGFRGKMLKFQYGAFNPADIELVKEWVAQHPDFTSNNILLNHSGSQSGNHKHLLAKLSTFGLDAKVKTPLSYGDKQHIADTLAFGKSVLGPSFHPILDYMDRNAYFELICTSDYAIFGHRRQEAGNTLFIALMTGTKIFLHPESVLLPFLKEQGYHFCTWANLSAKALSTPLTKEERERNYELACIQFSEETIAENYKRILG
jgi:hypothetical protein